MTSAINFTPAQVVARGRAILSDAGTVTDPSDFLEFSDTVGQVILDWPKARQSEPWVRDYALALRKLRDNFDREYAGDPMILYKPAHEVALAFHMSPALVRYNRAANRTSKSQGAYAEHYFCLTGQYRWRAYHPPPAATAIVGYNFTNYAPNIFERKMLTGEPGNPVAPMFPEGGRWYHHYDPRHHIITLCCRTCAAAWTPLECAHPKSTITLYSDEAGGTSMAGAQFNILHLDEEVDEEFFDEGFQRIKTVPRSCILVTGTPLKGKGSWEHQRLTSIWLKGPEENVIPGTQIPYVSVHTIDQYSAGLVPKELIDADRLTMDPLEQEARIWGRAAPLAKRSIFDRWALHEMDDAIVTARRGYLETEWLEAEAGLKPDLKHQPEFTAQRLGELRVWKEPEAGKQYIIGADVAEGLTGPSRKDKDDADSSCASVLSLPDFELVAQLHGWINPRDYADQTCVLGRWYNNALVVPERNAGPGIAMIQRIKEIGYWNVFRDINDPSQADFTLDPLIGVDTNVRTKGLMVTALQLVVAERQIIIHCADTLEEMRAFGQERTESGLSVRMRGTGGSKDDRVMSLVIAVYVALNYPVFDPRRSRGPVARDEEFWQSVRSEDKERSRPLRDKA